MTRSDLSKNICKAENMNIKQLSPKFILAIIDRWKNKGFYPDEVIINKKTFMKKQFFHFIKFINKN